MTSPIQPQDGSAGRWQAGLSWVRRASGLLVSDLGPKALAVRALELAIEAVPCDWALLELLSPDEIVLSRAAVYESGSVRATVGGEARERRVEEAGPVVQAAIKSGEVRSWVSVEGANGPGGAFLAVPLVGHDATHLEGLLTLRRLEPKPFSARDQALAFSLAAYLAGALENSILLAEVRRSESRLRQVIEGSWDGIATFGLDGELVSVSGHLPSATGIEPDEMVKLGWRRFVDEADQEEVGLALQSALAGSSSRTRFRYHKADGGISTAEAVVSPVSEDGAVVAVLAIVRDIAGLLEQESRLHESEKLAAIGRTIAGIAHDLSGPLTSVRGLAQVLQLDIEDEQLHEDVEVLLREADLAARIVEGLLAFVRRKKPDPQAIDVNELVKDLVRRTSGRALERGVDVKLEPGGDLPPIAGDPVQLDRVLRNLIRNAEDALLAVECERRVTVTTGSSGAGVWISVADNGPGVPSELAESIFDPLVTTKREGEGTGFGLAIARDIIEAHNGAIRCEPTPGGGATFVVELPLTDVSHLGGPRPDVSDAPPTDVKDVLVIDDDPAIRRAFKRLLERRGHRVVEAADGEEALELIVEQGQRYDRIFMDNQMPRMSGPQLFEKLARIPGVGERVTLITGDASSPQTRDFIERAGRPHVPKPFDVTDILRAVEEPL